MSRMMMDMTENVTVADEVYPTMNMSNRTMNQSTWTYGEEEYEVDYSEMDYYNIELRAAYILRQPYNVLALILSVLAIFLNVLVLAALSQVRNRISSHVRFIVSLAMADIVVSSSVLLHIVNKTLNPTYEAGGNAPYTARLLSRCTFMIIKALNTTGLNITLLSLLLMALDHYIAIIKPLQYPMIVCKKKVSILLSLSLF